MVTFLELECRGSAHEKINLGFIIKALEHTDKINFIADQSHIDIIKNQLPESIIRRINFINVQLPKKHYKILSIWHYYKIFKSFKSILIKSKKIFFLSFFSWNLIGFKLFLIFKNLKGKKIFFICHGVFEFLYDLKSYKRFKKYLKPKNAHVFFTKVSIGMFNLGEFKFVFLSKHIEKNYKTNIIDTLKLNFNSIYIPYQFDEIKPNFLNNNLTYGTIGKGDLDSTFKVLKTYPNLDLSIIRTIDTNQFNSFPNCKYFNQTNRLTREEINNQIKKVNYLLFFYPEESYTLSMSGAFVDAINYLKPIIFLKNECISYYNNIYNIGIECKNLEHLISKINSKELQKNYSHYISNIVKFKKEFQKNDFNMLWD